MPLPPVHTFHDPVPRWRRLPDQPYRRLPVGAASGRVSAGRLAASGPADRAVGYESACSVGLPGRPNSTAWRSHLRVLVLALGLLLGQAFGANEPILIAIDPTEIGRVFEGIGCLSAGASSRLLIDYPEPYRGQVLDYLFQPGYGAGFQHLKVEVGGDVNSTDGCEPSHMHTRRDQNYHRGYEWWLMREARRRNPAVFLDALEWGAPAWIGNGNFNSQDNADYLANFIRGAHRAHGLTIDFVGIWNETRADVGFIKRLRQTLDRRGLRQTRIVAMDEINRWSLVDVMATDPTLAQSVGVVGVHYPKYQSGAAAKQCGKPIWSSEDGPWKGNWSGAVALAKMYNRNYIEGRMTKTIVWSPVTAYYDNLPLPGSGVMRANAPWSGAYEVQPAVWATAHTTQFAQPGWRYLDSACRLLPGGGSAVALASGAAGSELSLIIETLDATNRLELVYALSGALASRAFHVWRSSAAEQFVSQPDLVAQEGKLRVTLDPGCIYSLTTTTGQRKGGAVGPIPAPFPRSYDESFEGYGVGATPRYFSDQAGIFEVVRRAKGPGRSLRQVIDRKGIEWPFHLNPLPESFLGDPNWRDYEVSVDAFIEREGFVALFGRAGKVPQNASPPDAYGLKVDEHGWWELGTANIPLASGRVAFSANAWHRLAIRFDGQQITAIIDHRTVATLQDGTYTAGMIGIGCGWHGAQFDNLTIRVNPDDANLAFGKRAAASSVWDTDHCAANATDGDGYTTRWSAASGRTSGEWLEIDLGQPTTFDCATVRPFDDRIKAYRLEWWNGQEWRGATEGKQLGGTAVSVSFPSVTANRVRFVVTEAKDPPSLWELELRHRAHR